MIGVLLGPQQSRNTLSAAVEALGKPGPIATVTAGWQEREDQDVELPAQLGRETFNLRLYSRAEEVFAADPEFAKAHRQRQDYLRQVQEIYQLRLARSYDAALDIDRKKVSDELHAEEKTRSIEQMRLLDREHLERCNEVRLAFETAHKPLERDAIIKQQREIQKIMKGVQIIAIAGGHVAALLNRLRLFGIADMMTQHALIAWSGGAMVTSEHVVLFHESPPEGFGISEVLEEGLCLHRGVMPLPNPKLRLKLDDPFRVGWLARRYPQAKCVAFDQGESVRFDGDRWWHPDGTVQLMPDGSVNAKWAA